MFPYRFTGQAGLIDKCRMNQEIPVRFRESLRAKIPWAAESLLHIQTLRELAYAPPALAVVHDSRRLEFQAALCKSTIR